MSSSAWDPFTPVPLFAVPLFSSVIGGFEAHREALAREILELRRKHPGVRRSNRDDAWHSADELRGPPSPALRFVLRGVTTYARRCLAPYYDGWETTELRLGHYWANVLGPGGYNSPHHHQPQHWSGVFYVTAGGASPDDDAGQLEFLNPMPWQGVWGAGNSSHAPRDGMTMLFPSALVHYVHPHQGRGVRISIAYNLDVVSKPAP